MARYLPILFALFLAPHTLAANDTDFEYGPRPASPVFDPRGLLEPKTVKEISEPLRVVYQKEGIDVVVVILDDVGASPPEHVAGRFAEAWCKTPIHSVVLHVPGRDGSPWIIPGGKLVEQLKSEEIQKAVADATRRVSSESNDADKVKAAVTEATDMLRFWMGNAINRSERIQRISAIQRQADEQKKQDRKLMMVTAAACAIPFIFITVFFLIFLRNRKPRIFPDFTIQHRLGAPHSGGNHAVVHFGPPAH